MNPDCLTIPASQHIDHPSPGGCDRLAGNVELRQVTIVSGRRPRHFRIATVGLRAGDLAFGALPCCGSIIQIEVRTSARGIVFGQSDACLALCGEAS